MSDTYFVKIAVSNTGFDAGRIFSTVAECVEVEKNGTLVVTSTLGTKLLLDESKWQSVHITRVKEDAEGSTRSEAPR